MAEEKKLQKMAAESMENGYGINHVYGKMAAEKVEMASEKM